MGSKKNTYKLQDWVFSRQRYWGEPIPMIHAPLTPKMTINFYEQKNFDALKNGTKTIETRALNPEEKERYFGDVVVGDTLCFLNKNTQEQFFVKVKKIYVWKSFEELYADPLLEYIYADKEKISQLTSVEDLKNGYNYIPDYVEKIEKNGLV